MDNPLLPANDRYTQALYDGSPDYTFDFPAPQPGGGMSGLCPALAAQRFPSVAD